MRRTGLSANRPRSTAAWHAIDNTLRTSRTDVADNGRRPPFQRHTAGELAEPPLQHPRLELCELQLAEPRHDVPADRPAVLVERRPINPFPLGREPDQLEKPGDRSPLATPRRRQRCVQRRLGLLP